MGSAGQRYVKSWTSNPLENIATGSGVATYKAAGSPGNLSTRKTLGLPEVLPGAEKVRGFSIPKTLQEAEMQMIQRQADIAAGRAESISGLQYNKALEDLAKQSQSAVASARGVSNPALLERDAMMRTQQAGLDLARESAAARLAEQRGADEMIARQAAAARGIALQQDLANQQAKTAQRGQNLSMIGNLGGAFAGLATGGARAGAAAAAKPTTTEQAYGGYGSGYDNSDENMKENIKPSKGDANKLISDFMDAMKSYTYKYKESENNGKENPKGEVTSVMAQDLEDSDLGKQMVREGKDGKMVDYAKGMAPLFAAIAELNDRTKKLEGK